MGADSSDIYRSLEQRIDNVMILGRVLKTEPKSKQKTGTGNKGLGGASIWAHMMQLQEGCQGQLHSGVERSPTSCGGRCYVLSQAKTRQLHDENDPRSKSTYDASQNHAGHGVAGMMLNCSRCLTCWATTPDATMMRCVRCDHGTFAQAPGSASCRHW